MSLTVDPNAFRLPPELARAVEGKRVLITGAGKDGGLGQAFAFAAAMNGASAVGVHFFRSYEDALDTVNLIREQGGNAFPVQADVRSPSEVWATRSHVIRKMEGLPDLVICNSGLSESGYLLGRTAREEDVESPARRRARTRRAFVDNLEESFAVLDTKVDGFLAMTHLWAGEATHAEQPLDICYISSRQAVDAGAGVPGYVLANWAVLALPGILEVNLARRSDLVTAFSVAYPFVRTGMTEAYAGNEKVFGRWQPRMLETPEAAQALVELLGRPAEARRGRTFQLDVGGTAEDIAISWSEVAVTAATRPVEPTTPP